MTIFYQYNSLNENQLINSTIQFGAVNNCLSVISNNILSKEYEEKYLPLMFFMKFDSSYSHSTKDLYTVSNKKSIPNTDLQIYPIAVRYIDDLNTYYIERPPFKKEISFNIKKNRAIKTSIWIPWTLTALSASPDYISHTRLYFSNSCLNNELDKYVPAFTPNIYQDGRICFSNSLESYNDLYSNSEIRLKYNIIFNEYMNGGWNVDLSPIFKPLCNAFDSKNKLFKNFPILDKFFNISSKEISDANPDLNIKTIDSAFAYSDDYYVQSRRMYTLFFLRLSTLSLEETLSFYQQVIEFLDIADIGLETKSFQQILLNSKLNYQSTFSYSQLFDKIDTILNSDKIDKNYHDFSGTLKIIIKNYENTSSMLHNNQPLSISLKQLVDNISNHGYKLEAVVCNSLGAEMLLTIISNKINNIGTSIVECDLDNKTITYLDENSLFNHSLTQAYTSYISLNIKRSYDYVD